MNLLPDELTLEVLSRLPQSSLLAYSQTCQKNLAFVRGSFIKTVPPRFLAERLFPQGLVEPQDKFSIARDAIRLIPAEPRLVSESVVLLAEKAPLDERVPILRTAFEIAETIKDSYTQGQHQQKALCALASKDPELARQLAGKITHNYFRCLSLLDIDASSTAAFEAAKVLDEPNERDLALSAIADRFPELTIAEAIDADSVRAEAYTEMAKKCVDTDPVRAEMLFLKAVEAAKNLKNEHYFKFRVYLQEPTIQLIKLRSKDVDKALEAVSSTNSKQMFDWLMIIAKAARGTNPEKSQEIFTKAIELRKNIAYKDYQMYADIELAYWYLVDGNSTQAVHFLESAKATIASMPPSTLLSDRIIGLALIATAFVSINPDYAKASANALVNVFQAITFDSEYKRFIEILHPHFPEQALVALKHTISNLQMAPNSFAEFKTLCSLVVTMKAADASIGKLLYTAATRCVARPSLILEFAPYLHPISPLDAIALFKKAYTDARTNKSYNDLIKCADLIAPLYPEIAAALYQEAHEIQPTYATALLGMAKTCPKHALAIHTYAIPLIARTEEKHYYIGRHLPAIVEHILS